MSEAKILRNIAADRAHCDFLREQLGKHLERAKGVEVKIADGHTVTARDLRHVEHAAARIEAIKKELGEIGQ